MSEQPNYTAQDLAPDLADRMRKSLRLSGVGVQEMADYLEVARNTVSTWINGRIVPNAQTVRLWSLRTGVPYVWLREGRVPPATPPGAPDAVHPLGFEPRTQWLRAFAGQRHLKEAS